MRARNSRRNAKRASAFYYEDPRRMHLFFYYPFDSGVVSAMADSGLRFAEEIDCMDLYDLFDSRERILVFEAG